MLSLEKLAVKISYKEIIRATATIRNIYPYHAYYVRTLLSHIRASVKQATTQKFVYILLDDTG